MARCKAKTKSGTQCKRKVTEESDYCYQHQNISQNDTNKEKSVLNKEQIKAIEMLIEGNKTKTEIAKECGIYRKKLYRWIEDESFKEEYDKRLQELKDKYASKLNRKIDETIKSLRPIMIESEKDKASYLDKLVKTQQLINGEATDIVKSEVEHSGEIDTKQNVNIVNQIVKDKELRDNLEEIHRKRQRLLEGSSESE